jgi:hypothetical protein
LKVSCVNKEGGAVEAEALPGFIRSALESRGLVVAYSRRSGAQREHYVRRILRAVRAETVQKRLDQMLDELEGDIYMKRPWMPR